jgi:hypothetical protein
MGYGRVGFELARGVERGRHHAASVVNISLINAKRHRGKPEMGRNLTSV